MNIYMKFALFLAAYLICGHRVIWYALKNIAKGRIFDENFLMFIASAGAFAIGEYPEAIAVMVFYQVGELLQEKAVDRSRGSISSLMELRPDRANLLRGKEISVVDPEEVHIGDVIIVKPGEKIPLDGVVTDGHSRIDTKTLTGEPVPRRADVGDEVMAGCVNVEGLLTIRATKNFGESAVAKILELTQSGKKAKTEEFITTFARYYTPIVVALAAIIAVVPAIFLGDWLQWLHRGLIFLVISCPCALVISIPLSFFAGIGAASKKGVLVKGGNVLEDLSKIKIAAFDKTGTLTKGVFDVQNIICLSDVSEEKILAFAASAEMFSTHPIARAIVRSYVSQFGEQPPNPQSFEEIAGQGVRAMVDGKNVCVGKGAAGEISVEIDSVLCGEIVVSDELRPDSAATVSGLKTLGISRTIMLTGDKKKSAEIIAAQVGIDEFHAELLPADKSEIVQKMTNILFVGDGINDAPVLAAADVGVAMGGLGSDAAIEAADVVLMTDEPSSLINGIKIARKTSIIARQNIVFALGVKVLFLVLGALGFANMWAAVFADVGVAMLAVCNALRVFWGGGQIKNKQKISLM